MHQGSVAVDVVICGGGLAGLTLARQLRLTLPDVSVVVLEKQGRPLPVAAHKVGESCVEGSTYYFSNVLGLQENLEQKHFFKLGLRFFLGGGSSPFEERFELGAPLWPLHPSFQLDRGVFENDLRELVAAQGIDLREGCSITDVRLSADQGPHEVHYRSDEGHEQSLRARWVIDATGRRRWLASKLDLKRSANHEVTACWWRVKGELDVEHLVPEERQDWVERIKPRRYFSTNHLMGDGYWVWLIPLGSGYTSIGIVGEENAHPAKQRNSYEKALAWLRDHEPELAAAHQGVDAEDFLVLKHFAHTTTQAFSEQRWACVGEAALFADPLYSIGSDLIAVANSITVKMIELDRRGELTSEAVANYNEWFVRTLSEMVFDLYRGQYGVLGGNEQILLKKLYWDTTFYWVYVAHTIIQHEYAPEAVAKYLEVGQRLAPLHRRTQVLLRDWSQAKGSAAPGADFYGLPLYTLKRPPYFTETATASELAAYQVECLERLEEWAQSLYEEAKAAVGANALTAADEWEAAGERLREQGRDPAAIARELQPVLLTPERIQMAFMRNMDPPSRDERYYQRPPRPARGIPLADSSTQ